MSCSKIDPALHQARKPDWIKVRLPSNPVFFSTKALISDLRLHTVCESAQCPNRWECWSSGTATFMIAGDRCLADFGLGSVSETTDGDAPHGATGCPFQAWSVAEVLRARRAIQSWPAASLRSSTRSAAAAAVGS